jgi:TetR/AcrR family transcriptional repressor of nem operon
MYAAAVNMRANNNIEVSETKRKLLDAAAELMRSNGYNATTVDDICAAAGVTKGGFFHYFKSKEEIAKAALLRFYEGRFQTSLNAPFRKLEDPLDRVLGRLDFAIEAFTDPKHRTKGCLIGMFAQEMSFASQELRAAAGEILERHARDFEEDLVAAKLSHAPAMDFDAYQIARLYVSTYQGGLMMAKASGSSAVLVENINQFRRYLLMLFGKLALQPEVLQN